jgi:hypothetical protein
LAVAVLAIALFSAPAFFSASAQATPISPPLQEHHLGDVTSDTLFVHYDLDANPATGTLHADGFPVEFDENDQGFFSGTFSLSLKINSATGAPLGGTIYIDGETTDTPYFNGVLLTGNITGFGFPDAGPNFGGGNIFEFLFTVTGGALAPSYYSAGYGGIIMNIKNGSDPSNPFTGVFTAPFKNNGDQPFAVGGVSDTFPMPTPEPSSLALLLLGCAPLVWRLRKRSRHPA